MALRQSEAEPRPGPKTRYQCPVCGYELELDEAFDSLVMTQLLDEREPRQIH